MRLHLSEAALRAVVRGPSGEASSHLRSCTRCRRRAAAYAALVTTTADGACPLPAALVQWAEDDTAGRRDPAVADHLVTCLDCAAEVESLARVLASGKRPPLAAPPTTSRPSLKARLAALVSFDMPAQVALVTRGGRRLKASPGLRAAMELYSSGRYAEARRKLSALRRAGDSSPATSLYEGVCELNLGRPRQAAIALSTAAAAQPRRGEARWYLVQALLAEGRGGEALARLDSLARRGDVFGHRAQRLAPAVRAALRSSRRRPTSDK